MGAVTSSNITKRPHLHISTIGLPWLSYAFGISVGAPLSSSWRRLVSFTYQIRRRHSHDDLNMPALNKANFPNLKLQRIRVLSQSTPNTLNKSDKTSGENGGYDRWNRSSTACLRSGIRLEDCSWQFFRDASSRRFLRTTSTKVEMNLEMRNLTTTTMTMTTVGNGYLNLMESPKGFSARCQ